MSMPISASGGGAQTPDRAARNQVGAQRETNGNPEFFALLRGQGDLQPIRNDFAGGPAYDFKQPGQTTPIDGGIEIEAAGQRFNLAITTASNAIAFEARPVVGPVAIALTLGQDAAVPPVSLPAGGQAAGGSGDRGALPVSFAALDPAGGAGVPKAAPQDARPAQRPTGAAASSTAVRPSQAPGSSAAPLPVTDNTPDAASEPTLDLATFGDERPYTGRASEWPTHLSARSQLLANLLASAEDYRVIVRGAALGQREERALAKAVRSALREFGLPDRTVIVTARGRES